MRDDMLRHVVLGSVWDYCWLFMLLVTTISFLSVVFLLPVYWLSSFCFHLHTQKCWERFRAAAAARQKCKPGQKFNFNRQRYKI